MSEKQIKQNFSLSSKLTKYLLKNKQLMGKYANGITFVVFSAKDEQLNKLNNDLAIKLIKQGKKVVKAKEPKNYKSPWILTPSFS